MSAKRPFTRESLGNWLDTEGSISLTPSGCMPEKTCKEAKLAVVQKDEPELLQSICDSLEREFGIAKNSCSVKRRDGAIYEAFMQNPTEIKKVTDGLKPLIRTKKMIKQIEEFEKFFQSRRGRFKPFKPKPRKNSF